MGQGLMALPLSTRFADADASRSDPNPGFVALGLGSDRAGVPEIRTIASTGISTPVAARAQQHFQPRPGAGS